MSETSTRFCNIHLGPGRSGSEVYAARSILSELAGQELDCETDEEVAQVLGHCSIACEALEDDMTEDELVRAVREALRERWPDVKQRTTLLSGPATLLLFTASARYTSPLETAMLGVAEDAAFCEMAVQETAVALKKAVAWLLPVGILSTRLMWPLNGTWKVDVVWSAWR